MRIMVNLWYLSRLASTVTNPISGISPLNDPVWHIVQLVSDISSLNDPSVRPSITLYFFGLSRSLATLLLPKWSSDLKYGPCPSTRDLGSRVSSLVFWNLISKWSKFTYNATNSIKNWISFWSFAPKWSHLIFSATDPILNSIRFWGFVSPAFSNGFHRLPLPASWDVFPLPPTIAIYPIIPVRTINAYSGVRGITA